jgi:hypothetical protein
LPDERVITRSIALAGPRVGHGIQTPIVPSFPAAYEEFSFREDQYEKMRSYH